MTRTSWSSRSAPTGTLRREATIQKKDLERLDRILGLLGSDHAGERASAAAAADALLKKHKLSWHDLVAHGLTQGPQRRELGVDYLEAAQSRLRQMKAHNEALEKQVSRLKAQLEALKETVR